MAHPRTAGLTPATTLLLNLVRGALWGQHAIDLTTVAEARVAWPQVLTAANGQTVTGLASQALELLPDELLPDDDTLELWAATVQRIEHNSQQVNTALTGLLPYIYTRARGTASAAATVPTASTASAATVPGVSNAGSSSSLPLSPILLKGQGLAALYAQPLLRQSGDIDLYFPPNERKQARTVLEALCGPATVHPDGSYSVHFKSVEIEVHSQLFDIYTPFRRRHLRTLMQETGTTDLDINGTAVRILAPEANLLMQSAHILKHALGRGIGLRQMCDFAVSCRAWADTIDHGRMEQYSHRLGLHRWHSQLFTFLTDVLAMPSQLLPHDAPRADITTLRRMVLTGGNFGRALDTGTHTPGALHRKASTALSFARHIPFALSCSPSEAFWGAASLITGQIKC